MAVTNKDAKATVHANKMGGASYDITSPLTKLRIAAASSFFGEPQYYQEKEASNPATINASSRVSDADYKRLIDILKGVIPATFSAGKTPAQVLESVIDDALDFDLEGTLQIAVALRNEDYIRTTPQVILVRAANHKDAKGTGLIRKYAKDIIKRTDEPSVQMAYQLKAYGKSIPNALKKAWRDSLEGANEYQLAKYRMENRKVKTVDVVRMAHAHSPVIDKLIRDELKLDNGQTWESLVSAKGSNKETWTEAVDIMGHMALLRNMRNLQQNGVPLSLYKDKLVDGVLKGKQLPFRYWSAYNALKGASAPLANLAAVEECLDVSIANLPTLEGKVMALCDNSGSAHGTLTSKYGSVKVSEIANLTAVLTGMVADEGYVGVFGDKLDTFKVDKTGSVLTQAEKANKIGKSIGMGTETGVWLFWDNAIKNKVHFDHVVIYSDMQAGYGQLYTNAANTPSKEFAWNKGRYDSNYVDVPALIAHYRKVVNPDVKVYTVQVAGYTDTLIPDTYDKTYMFSGWGDGIIRYMAKMAEITSK